MGQRRVICVVIDDKSLGWAREEDFLKSANQKQELPVAAMLVNGSGRNEQ